MAMRSCYSRRGSPSTNTSAPAAFSALLRFYGRAVNYALHACASAFRCLGSAASRSPPEGLRAPENEGCSAVRLLRAPEGGRPGWWWRIPCGGGVCVCVLLDCQRLSLPLGRCLFALSSSPLCVCVCVTLFIMSPLFALLIFLPLSIRMLCCCDCFFLIISTCCSLGYSLGQLITF